MWKICRGEPRNLANNIKLAHGIWKNLPVKTVVPSMKIYTVYSMVILAGVFV